MLVTSDGTGASTWRQHALTSFAADRVADRDGLFVYVRDAASGALWSVGRQPVACADERYEACWSYGKFEIRRECEGIETHLEICVPPDGALEIRRIGLLNRSSTRRSVELTTFGEVVLNDALAHAAHPAFSKLFLQTELVPEKRTLLVRRRPRAEGESHPWLLHTLLERDPDFETSRERFLGRDSGPSSPAALTSDEPLSGTAGNVLDPIVSLRDFVALEPGERATATFLLGVGPGRREALELRDRFAQPGAVEDAFAAAAENERGACEALGLAEADAEYFQSLAAAMLYGHPGLRADARTVSRARGTWDDLTRFGLRPGTALAVLHADRANGAALREEFLRGAKYWRARGYPVDAVIVGERNSSAPDREDDVRILSRAEMSDTDVDLLDAVARWVVGDALPDLSDFGDAPAVRATRPGPAPRVDVGGAGSSRPERSEVDGRAAPETQELFNGYGGFAEQGREYVILSGENLRRPPRPWINVVANERFGFLVSETGAGTTWSGNSREHRLTPWYNDPLLDPHGEALYVRDEESGAFWSALPGPAPGQGRYEMRHGFGYSVASFASDGLEHETTLFVPRHDPVKIARVRVTNRSGRARRLSLFAYQHLVLGVLPEDGASVLVTEQNAAASAPPAHEENAAVLFARNPLAGDFARGVAFAAAVTTSPARSVHFTADRASFLGLGGSPQDPAALHSRDPLDGRSGRGTDPCFAQQVLVDVAAGASVEVAFLLGEGDGDDEARALIARYAAPGAIDAALADVRAFWTHRLGGVRIETPSRALDLLVNGWLPYQTLSCRLWGRSAFYQSGGAFGFRDQLQDAAALLWLWPELTREQILRNAAHQFFEGDVLHWWHPPASRGIRTRFADDLLWLPAVTAQYVAATGDRAILSESVRFLRAPALEPGEDEVFLRPQDVGDSGDVYEHCCRAIDRSLSCGAHGLPLFGTGDWNDGMNRVGRGGRGESVWMAFFLAWILEEFAPLCRERGDETRLGRYETHRTQLREAIETHAWDGEWYRRGYYDDGTPLGSSSSDECRIDALAQAWSVLSGVASPARAAQAMDSVERHLISEEDGLIRLLTPPFENTPHDPGYIKGYVRGVRENGGQYTHAALWVVAAMARLGRNDRVAKLLDLINPVSHTRTPELVDVYQVEPYVVAADVYGEPPHVGRGGWTWYTGSAGWMIRAALESLLGLRILGGKELVVAPCIPDDWPGFSVAYRVPGEETRYEIRVLNPRGRAQQVIAASVDGTATTVDAGAARVPLLHDGRTHLVDVLLGGAPGRAAS